MSAAGTTIRFKMSFPAKVIGDPLIHTLSRDFNVVPNILRGRIAEKNAWLEVELSGPAKNVDKALAFLRERGVAIEKLR
jgi:ABC-type methionine transport system ATPase subunit